MSDQRTHLRPGLIAFVAVGGMVGTSARYGLVLALPHDGGWPLATFLANVVGAFGLGALLEALLRRGPESRRARQLRLAVGTGMLGGFTTYSSLALETHQLAADGAPLLGFAYALGSLVLGFIACFAGVLLAARRHRRGTGDPQ